VTDDRYKLVREIGTGTWGTVYEAVVRTTGHRLALKVLHPVWERHETAAAGLSKDLDRLRALDHPGIVRTEGLVRVSGRQALVMEFVQGIDLATLVKQLRTEHEEVGFRAVLEMMGEAAQALDAAHSRGVVHRGLKPANMVLTRQAHMKLLDFGTARDEFEEAEAYTQSVRYGSLRYREPERRHGGVSSPAGDVYALAAVIYEVLARRPLGNAELDSKDHQGLVDKGLAGLPSHVEPLKPLLRGMLAHDAETRPAAAEVKASAEALAEELRGTGGLPHAVYRFVPQASDLFEEPTDIGRQTTGELMLPSEAITDQTPVYSGSALPDIATASDLVVTGDTVVASRVPWLMIAGVVGVLGAIVAVVAWLR